ncbi:MAG TPA: helix-turn-helix transcriptional regulator [Planosporangium sp.]|nr:helix-turn-helix transcriptional regulator [Planosporangium sp.]
MAPQPPRDPVVGDRIRQRREQRGWSVRHLASRAGISHSALSMIERGQRGANNRYVIAKIAGALGCSVTELTGQPYVPGDVNLESVGGHVHGLRRVMINDSLDVPAATGLRPIEALEQATDLVRDLHHRCDYAGVVSLLPALLTDLQTARNRHGATSLHLSVHAYRVAMSTLRHLGYLSDAWWAAHQCRQVAEALGEPTALAVADYVRSRAAAYCGSYQASALVAARAAVEIDRHPGAPGAVELLGSLHITCAMSAAADSYDEAVDRLAEADRLARSTGETGLHDLWFGPTLVGLGRLIVEVDAGDSGRALEVAAQLNPAVIPAPTRQVHYYIDRSRALANIGRVEEAARSLLTAERFAPQHVRMSVVARETVRYLERRVRSRALLFGLPERMGLTS